MHAIHLAASAGHIAAVKELCTNGCDVDTPIVGGAGLLENARAIHVAAFSGCSEMIFVLHELKCNIDPPGAWGSPLLSATIASESEAIRTLCSIRCNPDCRDTNDQTPMMHSAGGGRLDVIRTLLSVRADINQR